MTDDVPLDCAVIAGGLQETNSEDPLVFHTVEVSVLTYLTFVTCYNLPYNTDLYRNFICLVWYRIDRIFVYDIVAVVNRLMVGQLVRFESGLGFFCSC